MSDRQKIPLPPEIIVAAITLPILFTLLAMVVVASLQPPPPAPLPPPTPIDTPTATLTFTPLPTWTDIPSWTPLPTWTPTPSPTPTITPTRTPGPTPTATPYRDPLAVAPPLDLDTIIPWDSTRPVTILLMGIDRRPTQGGVRARTDTLLVLRYNPETNAAGMLSIPRDLFVAIPGRSSSRINSAYVYGGGDLARQTVEIALDVDIDYYAVVDFVAFTTLVDEIGGIDIDVPVAINDPTYPDHFYGFDPLYIPAGPQHMDGTTALAYARSRHSSSDFERAARQQQVLMALRDKAVNLNMLPHLLVRSPGLYSILANSFDTDLPFEQIVSLALAAGDIPRENIHTAVIDRSYVSPTVLRDGSQVLIPNEERIHALAAETLP